jgi:hypothetical protein
MTRYRWKAVAVGTFVACVFAGCRNGSRGEEDGASAATSTSTTVPPTTAERGPVVSGELTLQGAVVATGPVSVVFPRGDERLNSCEKIAKGTSGTYLIPLPSSVGQRQFTWEAVVRSYRGPGRFALGDLGPLAVEVVDRPNAKPVRFAAVAATTASLEVRPDNAGSFEFSGLSAGRRQVSGSLTWSCS